VIQLALVEIPVPHGIDMDEPGMRVPADATAPHRSCDDKRYILPRIVTLMRGSHKEESLVLDEGRDLGNKILGGYE
jgi:hypothetical protein